MLVSTRATCPVELVDGLVVAAVASLPEAALRGRGIISGTINERNETRRVTGDATSGSEQVTN